MTEVELFVDPGCPWAWIASRWLLEVAPQRGLEVYWRSYCLEIRDDYGVAPTVPPEYRQSALEGHAASHRMLRIFEAARVRHGEAAVDRLYLEWGRRRFSDTCPPLDRLPAECVAGAGVERDLAAAADDDEWDGPIRESMEVAYAFGGPRTQTPTIVVRSDPPHGYKGPVMAPAPTGEDAVRLWDALEVLASQDGFFEVTRPRREDARSHISFRAADDQGVRTRPPYA